jgi:hypothetical protein
MVIARPGIGICNIYVLNSFAKIKYARAEVIKNQCYQVISARTEAAAAN